MRTISKHTSNCTISSAVIDYVIHSSLDEDACWKQDPRERHIRASSVAPAPAEVTRGQMN